jgi:hypothetical protein
MNGMLARLFRTSVGCALVAAALALGGCVAEAGDDEQVDQSASALSDGTDTPTHGSLQGVVDTGHGEIIGATPMGAAPTGPGDNLPCAGEPEPNPWQPPGADGDGDGSSKGGPPVTPNEQQANQQQQQQQQTQPGSSGPMKH